MRLRTWQGARHGDEGGADAPEIYRTCQRKKDGSIEVVLDPAG